MTHAARNTIPASTVIDRSQRKLTMTTCTDSFIVFTAVFGGSAFVLITIYALSRVYVFLCISITFNVLAAVTAGAAIATMGLDSCVEINYKLSLAKLPPVGLQSTTVGDVGYDSNRVRSNTHRVGWFSNSWLGSLGNKRQKS
jgi:hypothetical protein